MSRGNFRGGRNGNNQNNMEMDEGDFNNGQMNNGGQMNNNGMGPRDVNYSQGNYDDGRGGMGRENSFNRGNDFGDDRRDFNRGRDNSPGRRGSPDRQGSPRNRGGPGPQQSGPGYGGPGNGGQGYGAPGYGGPGYVAPVPQPYVPQIPVQPAAGPNITININGNSNQGAQGGNLSTVPQPQSKNYGPENSNLVSQNQKINPPTGPIAFGNLGSYTFNQPKLVPTPPRNMPPPPQPMQCKPIPTSAKLTREEAQEVLLKWAKSQGCCESGKAVSEGHVTDIYSCNALEYVLETFTERRGFACNYAACSPGQTVDGISPQSTLPNPWLMSAQPTKTFDNTVTRINVPHTEILQPCFRCQQYGYLKCANCNGSGRARCTPCHGSGQQTNAQGQQQPCGTCQGTKMVDCIRCEQGRVECDVCKRTQMIKWYLQVWVQYTNHVDKYVNERTELPDQIVESNAGEILLQCEGRQVVPVQDCESNDLNQNSLRLIQKAAQAYNQENQLLQRHALKAISVVECTIVYETQPYKAWIIGSDKRVHWPNYPSKCCCTIL